MMITPLYRFAFKYLVKLGLKQKFKYFNQGKSLTREEVKEVLTLNLPYYENALRQELDLAIDLLKAKAPWLNTVSWLFVLALVVCAGSVKLWSLNQWFGALALGSGAMAFSIVIWVLFKSASLSRLKLEDGFEITPAGLIAAQIPLCLTQVQLTLGVLTTGLLTLSFLSIITSLSILVITVATQLSAMSNFIMRQDLKILSQNEVREFLRSTSPLYSRAAKAWLLSESMEGVRLSVGALQGMQCKDRDLDGDDPA